MLLIYVRLPPMAVNFLIRSRFSIRKSQIHIFGQSSPTITLRKRLNCNNWNESSFGGVAPCNATPLMSNRYAVNFCTDNQENNNPTILMSDQCVTKLKELINLQEGTFLRVLVEGGGCSGFQYKFDIDSTLNDDDRIFEKDGAKVVIDETSLEYIKGSTVDYQKELIRSAFRIINNPVAESGCSCGVSFSIKI